MCKDKKILLGVIIAAIVAMAGMVAGPALAVTTSHFVSGNKTDFTAGKLRNVVVTNLGDVKLSRAVEIIKQDDADVTAINALAEGPDGVIYAGTSPKGILLAVKDGKSSKLATLEDTVSILSLKVVDKGALLIGTGGDKGKLLRIDKRGDKPHEIFAEDSVQYVWAIAPTADGNIYIATGPTAAVYEIKPDGTHKQIYKNAEDNILSLISDGKDFLYAGTDPNGLVVRLNRKTGESFILYNAGENEVTALALDAAGNLYAGTGEAGERQSAVNPQGKPETNGRPAGEGGENPLPAPKPGNPPKPPAPPAPNPGEPHPIPAAKPQTLRWLETHPLLLDIDLKEMPAKPIPAAKKPADEPAPGEPAPNGPPGENPTVPNTPAGAQKPGPQPPMPPNPGEEQNKPEGNAIYKIDPEGFVTEIFRDNAVIYSLLWQDDALLAGTGGDGNIYQIKPASEETVVLAKVDAKQVMALLATANGKVILGLANSGGIGTMTSGYAADGDYTSPALDATQVSRFGKIQLHGRLPAGTSLKISTRSGNVKDANVDGWSKWTDPVDARQFVPVISPAARFLQYRLSFASSDPAKSAVVDHVDVAYQIPNLPPVIKSVKIGGDEAANNGAAPNMPNAPGGPHGPGPAPAGNTPHPQGTGTQTITWDASDPNNDMLLYALYFRMEGNGPWILLKDKLKDPTFDWDTKTVADGRYQIKVVASDAPSNPPGTEKTASRVSDYFVVNNTPPTIGDIVIKPDGKNLTVTLRVVDATSIIADAQFTVDSNEDWQAALPDGNIFDSLDEKLSFTIKNPGPGPHQLTIRATDARGNMAVQSVVIPEAK